MTAAERVQAVIAGRRPDRAPVSFWHHFPPDQVSGRAAVEAHRRHLEGFGLDFLKVMNDNGYPHRRPIERVEDLRGIMELEGDEDEFARQLEVIRELRRELGSDVWMTTTVFNGWAVLRGLVRPPRGHRPPEMRAEADEGSARLRELVRADESAVRGAIERVGVSLGRFARKCVEAGADGVFLSVRDDWVEVGDRNHGCTPMDTDVEEADPQITQITQMQSEGGTEGRKDGGMYGRLVRASDLEVLSGAAGGRFNMLHVCGRAVDFGAFAQYPVQVMNWADREAGPAIGEVAGWLGPAICGGVDNLRTLPEGSEADVEREVRDAIGQAGGRAMMVSPGCTYDPGRVPRSNLEAMVRAAREGG